MANAIYIPNDDPQYFSINYLDHGDPTRRAVLYAQWQSFNRLDPSTRQSHKIWVRPSNYQTEVTVDHLMPPASPAGRYRVETFVPGKHASTRKAIFTIATGVRPSEKGDLHLEETLAVVDMSALFDVWTPLGEFYLDPTRHADIGRVRQYDISGEEPPEEVSFGPVRWLPVMGRSGDGQPYDSPVGEPEEREGAFPPGRVMFGRYPVWAGDWFDVNPYLSWYVYGYHTGADLNLPGSSAADKGKSIYSIGEGLVTYAGRAGTWGSIIVIEHPDAVVTYPDGHIERQRVYSRYGHVEEQILVRAGEVVKQGQHIGYIGLAAGATTGWHLHFDISHSDILKGRPSHWPNIDAIRGGRISAHRNADGYERARSGIMRQVVSNYVDPFRFLQDNHGAL